VTVTNSSECSDNPQAKRDWGRRTVEGCVVESSRLAERCELREHLRAQPRAASGGNGGEEGGERGADHLDTALEMAVGAVGK